MTALRTEMLPHQAAAVEKVLPIRVGGLFMEMGTGKSRTAIELVHRREDRIDKVVWICPVGLKRTIRYEILKHTDTPPEQIHVFDERTTDANLPSTFWHIVGIESVGQSDRVTLALNALIDERTMVILDESSFIKGHRAKRTVRITELSKRARYRLILTGTPISQGIVDLFAQMRFLSPKILGYDSFYSFAANHLEYSDKFPGMIVRAHNVGYLTAKIQPYVYQVTKRECLNLPGKLYTNRYFEMTSEQRHYYELAKEELLMSLEEDDFDSIAIFRLFTALQQITSGYWTRRTGNTVERIEFPHDRLDTLMGVVSEIPADEKVIVWAKYRRDIRSIGEMLEREFGKESVVKYHGGMSERERDRELTRFRNDARFFVATQSAGGFGLTLNEAHNAVFYDNVFKYAERMQAEDRCYRIGQEHRVTYVDIICEDSIDTRIEQVLAKKGNVVDSFRSEVDRVKGQKAELRDLIKAL